MCFKHVRLISHPPRGPHRGQPSYAAQKGRTYDRTVPVCEINWESPCTAGRSTNDARHIRSNDSNPMRREKVIFEGPSVIWSAALAAFKKALAPIFPCVGTRRSAEAFIDGVLFSELS